MRRVLLAGLAVIGVLLMAIPAAFAKSDVAAAEPGNSARTITIGGTYPLSGPVASYGAIAVGMKAYFSHINARRGPDRKRGIYGRQIVWKFYDDTYNPVNSVQLTRRLVEEDKVFAVVGSVGTEVNEAVRPYLNSQRVPHVLASTGATQFGREYKQYPWTIGWQPDYVSEARIYGLDIRRNHPGAKIAILYQNDSYGKDYLNGFKAALGTARVREQVVGEVPYEVTGGPPTSQLVRLRATGADTLMIFVTTSATIQTYAIIRQLNWKPANIYVNNVSAADVWMTTAARVSSPETVNGSISTGYLKDPSAPRFANDATVKQYKALMEKYAPRANVNDGTYFYGFAKAHTFVRAMYKAGRNPTRAGLMRALTSFDETSPYLLPGARIKTSPRDRFMLSHQQLWRYQSGSWTAIGPLIDGRPRG
ncbi:MAG: ABC transporter substrate-binding protein [Actinomycetota bacterium]|nr:ABC transporter substrate-binding protein [Actinomycetota bacterium]